MVASCVQIGKAVKPEAMHQLQPKDCTMFALDLRTVADWTDV